MRPRFLVALAALAALAACDQAGQKGGPARAPIGATPPPKTAPTPTATPAPAVNCPTLKPACPTPAAAKAAAHRARPYRVARTARPHQYRTITSDGRQYSWRDDGLPHRPYRYDELPRDREATITLPYADDYAEPPPPYPESGYHRWSRGDGYRPYGHEHGREGRTYREDESPGHAPRYGHGMRHWGYGERSESRGGYAYGYGEAPPPPPPPRAYGHSEYGYGQYDRRAEGGYERREYRSYSEESSESSTHTVERGCCMAGGGQAAGYDARGYLTWPGKTPR